MGWEMSEMDGEWGSARQNVLRLIRSISGSVREDSNVSSPNPLFTPAPLEKPESSMYWRELRQAEALLYWKKLMDQPR